MNKESQKAYSRELKEEHFKQIEVVIKNGKTNNALTYPELQEELVEKFKGKTIAAPLEVIFTSFYFLTSHEMVALVESLKELVVLKFKSELLEKACNGEATKEDTMASIILAGLEMEKRKKRKEKEDTTTEKHELFS